MILQTVPGCLLFSLQVFDLLWRLISHDIWFVWERVEYLQVEDLDVLTQVPFKVTVILFIASGA